MTIDLPPLLSSDGHLEVKPERWTPRMPAKYRDKAPRTITLPDGGEALLVEGQEPRPVNFVDLRAGRTNDDWQPIGVRVEDTAGVGPPEQRVQEQDVDGLLSEVLFPNQGAGPGLWRTMQDEDAYVAAVHAYNQWLAEEYCPVSPDRLIAMGVIPWSSLDASLAELQYCARMGLKGVVLGQFPSGKAYPTPEDDKFWAAALDIGMPLTAHVGFNRQGRYANQTVFEYPDADPEMAQRLASRNFVSSVALSFMGLPAATTMSQVILFGVFERFPDLKIFFAETRLGWIPFWMEEADYWYERHHHWAQRLLNYKPLKEKPSDYIKRHIWFSCQHVERVAIELRHHMGVEHIMFATDFPHIECDWPNTRPFAERLFSEVPVDETWKIAAGNMLDYFKLSDTPMGRKALAGAPAGVV